MSFSTDLFAFLTADETLAGLIATRLYPDVMPATNAWPGCSMVYKGINGLKEQSNDGDSNLRRQSVQFDVYSRSREDIGTVMDRLSALLLPLKGSMGSTSVGAVFHVHDSSNFEPETRLFRGIVEFEFWHQT